MADPVTRRKIGGRWVIEGERVPLDLAVVKSVAGNCKHLGEPTGEVVSCPSCKGNVRIKTFSCAKFGKCTIGKWVKGIACCVGNLENGKFSPCEGYERGQAASPQTGILQAGIAKLREQITPPKLKWSYGVTTIPARREDLLPKTLRSLALAGFDKPWLFVDGERGLPKWLTDLEPHVAGITCHWPKLRTHGNWVTALEMLFIREPNADRYAIFQDDLVTYRNLRAYLESVPYPANGYLNLYTFPNNQEKAPKVGQTGRQQIGFYLSNQMGRGAVATVFSRDAVLALLTSRHMKERPMDADRGWKAVDGGIVTGLKKAEFHEFVHNPSLVQHTGLISSMGNGSHPQAPSFRGEDFDAMLLLKEAQE